MVNPKKHSASPRPRNAAKTRADILASALQAFARYGYDGAGVRDIARDAGVTAMLINRYFGSKEQLFAEVVEAAFAPPAFFASDPEALARDAAHNLIALSAPDAEQLGRFPIMLRSVPNPRAAQIVRDALARHVGRRLAAQLPEPDRHLRTELILSVIAGVWLMRSVIQTPELIEAAPERLTDAVSAVIQTIIDTPLDPC
ncbi:TetR/AcrR family transcriptional regulator [Mycobacterium florentinum]|uniref:TetR/AcrR family transcriptional regulator n=1 Tax=Mycobacterium florentinum TaxID=292462 RepID=UPI000A14B988|nr:TetR/AcrR family transcriptional regulator [Mycobacterium florentinum]MCV7412928.1 TetR/AcrR family transcriptional regulator [Mycobacterium florentinum]BBX76441.1 TetR family transcriptional regulator [Mycobacterium florentinum]